MRRGERRGSRAGERVDLVVVVAVQDPIRVGRERAIAGRDRHERAPGIARQALQRLAKPQLVERLGARAKIRHAVDLGHVADQAVDRPLERARAGGPAVGRGAVGVRRHAEGRHQRIVTPEHEADLLANDRVHVAHHRLAHDIAVEKRLRDPGGRLIGLVHEVEQRLTALVGRPLVGSVPLDHEPPDAGIEGHVERLARHRRRRRAREQREHEQGSCRAEPETDTPRPICGAGSRRGGGPLRADASARWPSLVEARRSIWQSGSRPPAPTLRSLTRSADRAAIRGAPTNLSV